jgi:diamine N-acetyltransferase
MQRPVVIRSATADEAERLQELGITGWETTYADFLRAENRAAYLAGPFWSVERLRAIIEDAACWALVAEVDEAVAGFLTLEPDAAGEIELTRCYVDPAYRGNGVGRELWQHALDLLQADRVLTVVVNVFGDNHAGRRFYERLGFTLIEETTTTIGSQTVYDVWYRLEIE